MRNKNILIVVVLCVAAAFQFFDQKTENHNTPMNKSKAWANSVTGRVERVVDGDSLYVAGQKKQIRMWAVDAPERNESGYQAATKLLKKIALRNKVRCEIKDTDKYGRIVARCELEDGTDINKKMIESGLTQEYCRFSHNHYGHC